MARDLIAIMADVSPDLAGTHGQVRWLGTAIRSHGDVSRPLPLKKYMRRFATHPWGKLSRLQEFQEIGLFAGGTATSGAVSAAEPPWATCGPDPT